MKLILPNSGINDDHFTITLIISSLGSYFSTYEQISPKVGKSFYIFNNQDYLQINISLIRLLNNLGM